ncbi:MAG: GrpB family protein [Candidatus Eisenbacteria bacterium]
MHDEGAVHFAGEDAFRDDVAAAYAEVGGELRALLPHACLNHVGSTAVPGSLTKGDLDVCVCVGADAFAAADQALAHVFARNEGSTRTPTFSAFECTVHGVPVGVQLVVEGSADDVFVAWRDLLRADPGLRTEYDALKRRFEGAPMERYREAKSAFIEERLGRGSAPA